MSCVCEDKLQLDRERSKSYEEEIQPNNIKEKKQNSGVVECNELLLRSF